MTGTLGRRLARLEALPPPPPPPPPWRDTVSPAVAAYLDAVADEVLAPLREHVAWSFSLRGDFYWNINDRQAEHPALVIADELIEGIATRRTPTITARQAQARLLRWAQARVRSWERLIGVHPTEADWWPMVRTLDLPAQRHQAGELWVGYWRRGGTRDADTLAALRFGLPELVLLAADDEPATTGDDTGGDE